ncbi:Polynucleotide kinase 3 phosphatase [seawater metagenome]|uniref:Polynucleotide kinase 3 phosphatase n=1 Tax=seawater metagenome TaxID=1561972 RepID=A0A5E8CLE8_9ZZZZ
MDSVIFINNTNLKKNEYIKIAGFDFDFTLVKTKSNAKFPKNENDWIVWDKSILPELKKLVSEGYQLVIFSNQNGVSGGQTTLEKVKARFQQFMDFTNLNWICMASIKKDKYRKPGIGMFEYLETQYSINKGDSFYVGDAAGRKKQGKIKADFSCSDRKFAFNLGIKFLTPEEFFLKQAINNKFMIQGFNPFNYNFETNKFNLEPKKKKQMIIMVGCPCSGKSTFCKTYYPDYEYINQDKLKTKGKVFKALEKNLEDENSVIIDSTNPDKKIRADYIKLAKEHNYFVITYIITMEKEMAIHMNWFRTKTSDREFIPLLVFHIFFKKLEIPEIEEGINKIRILQPRLNFEYEEKQIFLQLT